MMMYCQVSLPELPPVRLLKTSFIGIETEPKQIFNINTNSNDNVKMENKRVFRFWNIYFQVSCHFDEGGSNEVNR